MKRNRKDYQQAQKRRDPICGECARKRKQQPDHLLKNIGCATTVCDQRLGRRKVVIPLNGETKPQHQNHNAQSAEDRSQSDKQISQLCPQVFAVVGVFHKTVDPVFGSGGPKLDAVNFMRKQWAHDGMSKLVDRGSDHRCNVKDGGRTATEQARKQTGAEPHGKTAQRNNPQRKSQQLQCI